MDEKPGRPKPRLRWYQYSLRTLLLVTPVAGMLCASGIRLVEKIVQARLAASVKSGCTQRCGCGLPPIPHAVAVLSSGISGDRHPLNPPNRPTGVKTA